MTTTAAVASALAALGAVVARRSARSSSNSSNPRVPRGRKPTQKITTAAAAAEQGAMKVPDEDSDIATVLYTRCA